jgi:hypothetical protein
MILEKTVITKTVACDREGCDRSFTFEVTPDVKFPEWFDTAFFVTLPNIEKIVTYCCPDCCILGANAGQLAQPKPSLIDIAQPGEVQHVAKQAAATQAMKGGLHVV